MKRFAKKRQRHFLVYAHRLKIPLVLLISLSLAFMYSITSVYAVKNSDPISESQAAEDANNASDSSGKEPAVQLESSVQTEPAVQADQLPTTQPEAELNSEQTALVNDEIQTETETSTQNAEQESNSPQDQTEEDLNAQKEVSPIDTNQKPADLDKQNQSNGSLKENVSADNTGNMSETDEAESGSDPIINEEQNKQASSNPEAEKQDQIIQESSNENSAPEKANPDAEQDFGSDDSKNSKTPEESSTSALDKEASLSADETDNPVSKELNHDPELLELAADGQEVEGVCRIQSDSFKELNAEVFCFSDLFTKIPQLQTGFFDPKEAGVFYGRNLNEVSGHELLEDFSLIGMNLFFIEGSEDTEIKADQNPDLQKETIPYLFRVFLPLSCFEKNPSIESLQLFELKKDSSALQKIDADIQKDSNSLVLTFEAESPGLFVLAWKPEKSADTENSQNQELESEKRDPSDLKQEENTNPEIQEEKDQSEYQKPEEPEDSKEQADYKESADTEESEPDQTKSSKESMASSNPDLKQPDLSVRNGSSSEKQTGNLKSTEKADISTDSERTDLDTDPDIENNSPISLEGLQDSPALKAALISSDNPSSLKDLSDPTAGDSRDSEDSSDSAAADSVENTSSDTSSDPSNPEDKTSSSSNASDDLSLEEDFNPFGFPLYCYTVMPGYEGPQDLGNPNVEWNGMGVGTIDSDPYEYNVGQNFPLESFSYTLPKTYPDINYHGTVLTYNDSSNPPPDTYSIEWTGIVVSDGANEGHNNYNPYVDIWNQTFHLNGYIHPNIPEKVSVIFEIQQPGSSVFDASAEDSFEVDQGTDIASLVPNIPAEKEVNGTIYTFEGWYTSAACTQKADTDVKAEKNIIFYGRYIPKNAMMLSISKQVINGTQADLEKAYSFAFTLTNSDDGSLYTGLIDIISSWQGTGVLLPDENGQYVFTLKNGQNVIFGLPSGMKASLSETNLPEKMNPVFIVNDQNQLDQSYAEFDCTEHTGILVKNYRQITVPTGILKDSRMPLFWILLSAGGCIAVIFLFAKRSRKHSRRL